MIIIIDKNDNYREIIMFNCEFKNGRPTGKGQLYREKIVIKNTPKTNNSENVNNLIYCSETSHQIENKDNVAPKNLIELIRSSERNYNEFMKEYDEKYGKTKMIEL